jgi:hypothetical protein
MNTNTNKQKQQRKGRRWLAAGTVLVAGAAVMAGAAVTSAAIDNADDPGEVISMELVDRDADGNWFACAVDDVLWDDMLAVPADGIEAIEGIEGIEGVEGIEVLESSLDEISIDDADDVLGGMNGDVLAEAMSIELPDPGDIRTGTSDECADLTAFVLEPAGFTGEVGAASAD